MNAYAMVVIVRAEDPGQAQEVGARDTDDVLFAGTPWLVPDAQEFDTAGAVRQYLSAGPPDSCDPVAALNAATDGLLALGLDRFEVMDHVEAHADSQGAPAHA